jgi:adenosylcobinamide kinase/adenosylcobinamide-phosphate guanylyltransferase
MNPEASPIQSLSLVTGPVRSGKSEWAEYLAQQTGQSVIYIATGQSNPTDLEWQSRIEQHRHRRPQEWQTLEVPVDLPTTLSALSTPDHCLLVDSLGTWVANCLEQDETSWQQTLESFLNSLERLTGSVIFVAEETGWGVVPAYPLGRNFRDRLGTLVRRLGGVVNAVYLVTGGYVLNLTALGSPLPPITPSDPSQVL